jgi:hypothetical protein
MVSSYTDNLRLTLQGTGDNPNTWGEILNTVITLVGEAIAGVEDVTITGSSDVTLTTTNGTPDQARNATLVLKGTLGANINLILPAVEKQYFIRGAWSGAYTVTAKISGSSTSLVINSGDKKVVYTDGVDIFEMVPEAISPFATGDLEPTFRSTAKSGWLFVQGQTIGSTSSAATLKGADYEALYSFFWENISDTYCPVSSGKGVSASSDWAANKTLTIPDLRGRTPFGVDGSTWALGQTQGAESFTILEENLPELSPSFTGTTNSAGSHSHLLVHFNSASNGRLTNTTTADMSIAQRRIEGQGTMQNENFEYDLGAHSGTPDCGKSSTSGSHSHTVTGSLEPFGEDEPVEFLPKGFGVNWQVKL